MKLEFEFDYNAIDFWDIFKISKEESEELIWKGMIAYDRIEKNAEALKNIILEAKTQKELIIMIYAYARYKAIKEYMVLDTDVMHLN